MKSFVLFFTALLSTLTLTAQAAPVTKTFHYRVRVPATHNSCANEALRVGAAFATATGAQVNASECQGTIEFTSAGEKYKAYILVIKYEAAAEILPVSTFFTETFVMPGTQYIGGVFKNYADCIAALPEQVLTYEAQTGLQSVAATCTGDTVYDYARFYLRIDGFGVPKKKLFLFNAESFYNDASREQVRELIAEVGGTPALNMGRLIFYYAPKKLAVRDFVFSIFDTKEECAQQLDEARAIFFNSGSTRVYAHCVQLEYSGEALRVFGDGDTIISYNLTQVHGGYYTLAECLADRAAVLADETARGVAPLGAICRRDHMQNGYFTMDVYAALTLR